LHGITVLRNRTFETCTSLHFKEQNRSSLLRITVIGNAPCETSKEVHFVRDRTDETCIELKCSARKKIGETCRELYIVRKRIGETCTELQYSERKRISKNMHIITVPGSELVIPTQNLSVGKRISETCTELNKRKKENW
jgi:hypothetical protein